MSVCSSRGHRDRPHSFNEELAGRFAPLGGQRSADERPCLRCWELPDACLEVLPVPNSTKVYADPRSNSMGVGLYRPGKRPFRLHVAGLPAAELQARLERLGSFIKDPLFSQVLRHLERDVVWADNTSTSWPRFPRGAGVATSGATVVGGDDELTMLWPYWEKGYGDVIANTLLPMGELLRAGAMPRHLALSGMRHATLLPPLHATTATLCASERPNPPLLPRCASSCWPRVRICAPEFFESTRDTWRSTVALDAAAAKGAHNAHAGRPESAPREPAAAVAAAYAAVRAAEDYGLHRAAVGPMDGVLRVLIAARHGRRLLANAAELTAACNGARVGTDASGGGGVRLQCKMLPANAPQAVKIAELREADAYVCVWGGDTVHSLHMRRGSAVVELRSSGFAARAPWNWLELHRRWVTRFQGEAESRPLRFYPVLLARNASVFTEDDNACFVRNRQKQERWRLARAAANTSAEATLPARLRRPPPDENWLCYWNADLRAAVGDILPPLDDLVRGGTSARTSRGGRRFGKGHPKG